MTQGKKFLVIIAMVCATVSATVRRMPTNLSVAKERVEHYYECGHYDRDASRVIAQALRYFKRMKFCPQDVVVFDVDDTVLSNYCDEKTIRFGYIPKLSHAWILQADAPAIHHTKILYDYLVQCGVRIIFLTGRKHNEYDATAQNLRSVGFSTFQKLIVRSLEEENLSAAEYKTVQRKKIHQSGLRIVGTVGDQWSDLCGPHAGFRVKLPNVRYIIS